MQHEVEPHIAVEGKAPTDPNYQAYKDIEDFLKTNYMDKWVAFFEGQLVAVEDDRESLFNKAFEVTGHTGFMYKKIVEKEPVYHLRSPHVVISGRDRKRPGRRIK